MSDLVRPQHSFRDGPQSLDLRAFARGFALRARNTAWLVGAGTSVEAGVPTAGQLIDRLLAELYGSDMGLTLEAVLSRPRWQEIVYPLYDSQGGLPAITDDSFYSAIFERTYPDRDARARFIMETLAGRAPHHGQYILAGLVASELAPLLITTNFDTLLEDAIRDTLARVGTPTRPTVLDPQNSTRVDFAVATDQHPMLVKIHGDLGTVTLSNTEAELAQHDPSLRGIVQGQLSRYGLIVAGYSGRDAAVMQMLHDVLAQPHPYPAGLTWVRRPENPLPESVSELLEKARAAGAEPVHEVVVGGFGELMTELGRACQLAAPVRKWLEARRPTPVRIAAARPTGAVQSYPQVRFGAVEVTSLPTVARKLEASGPVVLPAARSALRAAEVRATVGWVGGKLVAFGHDRDLHAALAPLGITVTRDTVPVRPVRGVEVVDSGAVGMLVEALAQALARAPGLTAVLRTGRRPMLRVRTPRPGQSGRSDNMPPNVEALRAAVDGPVTGSLVGPRGARLPWAEAVSLGLEYIDDRWLLLFAPDIWTRPTFVTEQHPPPSRDDATKLAAEFVQQRVATRYTKQTGAILGAWLRLLAGGGRTVHAFSISSGDGIDAVFTIMGSPIVSRQLAGGRIQIAGGSRDDH